MPYDYLMSEEESAGAAAGFPLGRWLAGLRRCYGAGALEASRVAQREALGTRWATLWRIRSAVPPGDGGTPTLMEASWATFSRRRPVTLRGESVPGRANSSGGSCARRPRGRTPRREGGTGFVSSSVTRDVRVRHMCEGADFFPGSYLSLLPLLSWCDAEHEPVGMESGIRVRLAVLTVI